MLVNIIEDSPAAAAGLQPGDVVVEVNGKPVESAASLRNQVGLSRVGEKLKLTFVREGKRRNITIKVAERETAELPSDLRNERLPAGCRGGFARGRYHQLREPRTHAQPRGIPARRESAQRTNAAARSARQPRRVHGDQIVRGALNGSARAADTPDLSAGSRPARVEAGGTR